MATDPTKPIENARTDKAEKARDIHPDTSDDVIPENQPNETEHGNVGRDNASKPSNTETEIEQGRILDDSLIPQK